jgi:hypothetical protein
MMCEKAAAHHVECSIFTRQAKRIADDSVFLRTVPEVMMRAREMGMRHIQQSYIEHNPAPSQSLPYDLWYLAGSCGDFQQGKSFYPSRLSHAIYHLLRSRDAAKPAINSPQNG